MTAPLPLGLAEQIEALKANFNWPIASQAIDEAVSLCAEAWGKQDAARVASIDELNAVLAADQVDYGKEIAAQAARIEALETQLHERDQSAAKMKLCTGDML